MILRRLAFCGVATVLAFALALPAVPRPTAAQADEERILSFAAEIEIAADGVLHVVEEIEVVAAGQEIRRGIFRDFPLYGRTALGFNRVSGFQVDRIARDGQPEPWFLSDQPAGLRIYIGAAERMLPPGRHRYTIAYSTDRQLLHLDGEDELYWNVTGDAWSFPIEAASVTVRLPPGMAATGIAAFTGPPGSSEGAYRSLQDSTGMVRLATTVPLAPGEGFTVAIAWPEGAVTRPGFGQRLARLLDDNRGPVAGFVLLLVLLGYYLVAWHRLGRDPPKGVIFPRFHAPAGLSPVAAGYLWNIVLAGTFPDGRAMSVALTSLATHGMIVLEDDGKGAFAATRSRRPDGDLPAEERAVLTALFPGLPDDQAGPDQADGPEVDIGEDIGTATRTGFGRKYEPRLAASLAALKGHFGRDFDRRWIRRNRLAWLIGGALAVLVVLTAVLADSRGEGEAVVIGFVLLFATGFGTPVLMLVTAGVRHWRGLVRGSTAGVIVAVVVAILFLLPVGVVLGLLTELIPPAALAVSILAILAVILFRGWLQAPTPDGRAALDALEGYRLYLSLAEGDRLNQAGSTDEITAAIYEAHLPYAMALGVEQQWSARFAASLARSATDPDTARNGYKPSWYRHQSGSWQGPATLSNRLTRFLGGAAASASRRPSTSRSSGRSGGSSGGGRGGGGGGGW